MDADLVTSFNQFVNVISAKIYVDFPTGKSKGFGFFSYNSLVSSKHSIDNINLFQIGSKRINVRHKRVHHNRPLDVFQPKMSCSLSFSDM